MCIPALPAIGAALGALQIYGQVKQRDAQVAAQEQAARNAYRQANETQSTLASQRNLVAAQAVEQATQQQLQAAQAASAARVSAGEAGITGVGVNRIVGDVGMQLGQNLAITQSNVMREQSNIAAAQESTQLGLESQIKQYQTPVEGPSILDAALAIGGGYLGGMAQSAALGIDSGFAINTVTGEAVKQNVGFGGFLGNALKLEGYDLAPTTAVNFNALQNIMSQTDKATNVLLPAAEQTTKFKQTQLGYEEFATGQTNRKLQQVKRNY